MKTLIITIALVICVFVNSFADVLIGYSPSFPAIKPGLFIGHVKENNVSFFIEVKRNIDFHSRYCNINTWSVYQNRHDTFYGFKTNHTIINIGINYKFENGIVLYSGIGYFSKFKYDKYKDSSGNFYFAQNSFKEKINGTIGIILMNHNDYLQIGYDSASNGLVIGAGIPF